MSRIVQYFKDKSKTIKEYPISLTKAIYDESNNRLDNTLSGFVTSRTPVEYSGSQSIDANTLQGHPSSYFASKSDTHNTFAFHEHSFGEGSSIDSGVQTCYSFSPNLSGNYLVIASIRGATTSDNSAITGGVWVNSSEDWSSQTSYQSQYSSTPFTLQSVRFIQLSTTSTLYSTVWSNFGFNVNYVSYQFIKLL